MKMLIFLLFLLNLFKYFLCYKFEDFEIDLKSKHKINETTIITQETLQRIITGAEKGDKDNLYFLGLLKLYGITISKDVQGAAELFEKAALIGNPDAQTAIGMMKMKSIGVKEDFVGAVEMFRRAAEQDNGNGQWLLARMLVEGKGVRIENQQQNYLEGYYYALQAANNHHIPQAEHLVGILYEYGIGTSQNFELAIKYYRRASEQRYLESVYHLGLMYLYGRGTAQQFSRSLSLFEFGCESSHAQCCHYLGIMKTYGYGTSIDYEEAAAWFERSASLDDYRISEESRSYSKLLTDLIKEAREHNDKIVNEYVQKQDQFDNN